MDADHKDIVMTSIRLKPDLHRELRKIAFNSRRSMHSLLIEGADVVAAKYEERHGAPISLDKSAAPLPAEPVAQDK